MLEIKAPCLSKQTVSIDFSNLFLFLDFLENSQKSMISEINVINNKIKVIPDILSDIKDLKYNQEAHKKKIENIEQTIFNQHQKIMDLEINQRNHSDV